mmetsp:Transcript_10230/g.30816  ORF Transcript_10230/g.30816 Transcript_10230/m.30816 type:complete len:328 (+) Transcript_10230:385-1368(+)|eukprot:CAMPEP_0206138742 /NCGR_PEP_ID=MMETSP1473-20131121/3529_1 /ASSEMBLY_ACC=CAM_ASM_001109 /TAXON_ID=1461547 /ORGANISM="Stichococcus sp, Strain RCC1054" /LENGTH=327 /DNA_ID=CAMNT_0053532251 /DNA_START=353 /DNA_END=1336 /DNA_ORIENTATION=+
MLSAWQPQVASTSSLGIRRHVTTASFTPARFPPQHQIRQPLHQPSLQRLAAQPTSFRDQRHTQYYQPIVAGKLKLHKRIKQQQKRLKDIAQALPAQPTAISMQAILTEMQELSENLGAVSKLAKEAAESSSESSDSDSDAGVGKKKRKKGASPDLRALTVLASAAETSSHKPSPAQAVAAREAAVRQLELVLPVAREDDANSAIVSGLGSASDALPESARSQIVPLGKVPAARIAVCQSSSCCKRGGAALLRAATDAAAGAPDIEVTACKCLGKCKQGPVVRLRVGRQKPDLITQAAADGGAGVANFIREQQLAQEQQLARQPRLAV